MTRVLMALLALAAGWSMAVVTAEEPSAPDAPTTETPTDSADAAAPVERLRTIRNEHVAVVVSPYRASIAQFQLPEDHPIPVPVFRGGQGQETDREAPLPVLGEFNNVLTSHGVLVSGVTDMHSFVDGFTLPAAAGQEGDWLVDEEATTEQTLVLTKEWQGVSYRMAYRMDDARPTVHVTLQVVNITDAAIDLLPISLVPLSGIHQDDPAADAWQMSVVAHFGGEGGTFDKWGLPDPRGQKELRHPDTDTNRIQVSQIDYIGLKSRFYAALWKPGDMRIGSAGGALAAVDPNTFFVTMNAAGFREKRTESVFANQAQIQAFYGSAVLQPSQVMEIDWQITIAGMRDRYLDLLTPVEAKVEYTDGFYRFFRILVVIMEAILGLFQLVVVNYGIAILLLTVLVKALLHRTMVKQQTSMLKMQQLAPQMKRIQEQYKGDRQALAQKQMELFRENKVNPMGGCLPILIQMPIFIALYQTFSHAADMRGHSFLWVPDLTLPDYTFNTGLTDLWLIGDLTINVLPILYIIVSWWAASAFKPPKGASEQQVQMAKMMKWLPVIFGIIFYKMPAGLVLYFTFSGLLGSLEMRWIRKRLGIGQDNDNEPATSSP